MGEVAVGGWELCIRQPVRQRGGDVGLGSLGASGITRPEASRERLVMVQAASVPAGAAFVGIADADSGHEA